MPNLFTDDQFGILTSICESIFPGDIEGAGAAAAGAPELIDLLTSENKRYQLVISGGICWLDAFCRRLFDKPYLNCSSGKRHIALGRMSRRSNLQSDCSLSYGITFFALVRRLTADVFFTSEVGIRYLGYIGNDWLENFPGCPPLPDEIDREIIASGPEMTTSLARGKVITFSIS